MKDFQLIYKLIISCKGEYSAREIMILVKDRKYDQHSKAEYVSRVRTRENKGILGMGDN